MRQYFILLLVLPLVIAACSSNNMEIATQAISLSPAQVSTPLTTPVKPTATRFATRTAAPRPSLTPSPSPSAIPTLGFELPSECAKIDPAIDPRIHQAYNFVYGACGYPSLSPDGSLIAFVTLVPTTTTEHPNDAVPVVKLYSIASAKTSSIYQAQCAFLKPRWAPTGHLVITDFPPDVGCGYTAIYDPVQGKTLAVLDGVAYEQDWSDDQSAFFVLRTGGYGPTCDDSLSIFDLSSGTQLPPLKPTTPDTKIYAVVGQPIWMPDTKTLLVTLRDGICSSEADCEYRNSYVVAYARVGSTIKGSYLFDDPAIDYSFHRTVQGTVEFRSASSKPMSCYDIHSTDGT
jgi:hypothetical protein